MAKKISVEEIKPVQSEVFDVLKLKMLTDGLFKYECLDVEALDREIFSCETAKKYGVRSGNIVMLVDKSEVKSILVG